jgi:hypothetical protein
MEYHARMRVLLMISNNQMSLRELYTAVLDTHPAGWVTSFMSGMPSDAASIVGGYDAVVYELGAPNIQDRVTTALSLAKGRVPVITHVEGREAPQWTQELTHAGVEVVANPVTSTHISEALDRLALVLRSTAASKKESFATRFRRVFTG